VTRHNKFFSPPYLVECCGFPRSVLKWWEKSSSDVLNLFLKECIFRPIYAYFVQYFAAPVIYEDTLNNLIRLVKHTHKSRCTSVVMRSSMLVCCCVIHIYLCNEQNEYQTK